jgi:hypothetical protein
MTSTRDRSFQLSVRRRRILARQRRASLMDRATDLFLALLGGGLVVYGFIRGGWVGLLIALIAVMLMAAIYLGSIWVYGVMARLLARRAVRQMHARSASDTDGIQPDAWLIVGGNNLLIADVAKRLVLLHIRGAGWHALPMHDIKRLGVARQNTWLRSSTTALTISDELAGPPLLELSVVEGDAEHFVKVASLRSAAA